MPVLYTRWRQKDEFYLPLKTAVCLHFWQLFVYIFDSCLFTFFTTCIYTHFSYFDTLDAI